jgi:hypothetical protein
MSNLEETTPYPGARFRSPTDLAGDRWPNDDAENPWESTRAWARLAVAGILIACLLSLVG